jgi:hypothetical protein
MADPRRWSFSELRNLTIEATEQFRIQRRTEPVTYPDFFQAFVPVFIDLIDNALPRLTETDADVDREMLASIVSDESARTAFRYLASPPISDDDLKTIAASSLSATALRMDPAQANRVRDAVLNVIDPHRFPWVGAHRSPSERERQIAIVASAVLVATQKVGTSRRGNSKSEQEQRVKDLLSEMGFTEVPPRKIPLLEDGPSPGEFCGESRFGDTRADLIARLPDRRYLALECKVSNSFKRVNHEALGKARRWVSQFGTLAVVPAAILAGVFNPSNIETAQAGGLFLIWSHRLDSLRNFIESCHPSDGRRRPKR